MFSKRNPVVNRILVVIDGDNLFSNVIADARHYSLAKGLERLIKQLTQVGEVVGVFVFGPPDLINRNLGALQNEGFWPIPCQEKQINKENRLMLSMARLLPLSGTCWN